MALNKDRIFKAADNYIRKNKIDKAIGEYETWLKENPKDWNIIRTVGDLYARISRNDEAIKKYALVADHYRRDGFNVRAIATYKMVLRLDANNEAAMRNLAELQAEEGLLMEAKSNLNTLVKLYNKQGHKRLATEVFKKLAEIDPQDLKTRYSYAEFLNQSGKADEAAEEYVGIADQLIGQGQVDDAVKILEKGSSLATNSPALKVKLAHASSLQGNYAQAVRMLEEVRRGSPNDRLVLARLGEAYLASGNTDQAQGAFQQLIEVDPDNPDNILRLADLRIAQGKLDTALDELTPLIDRRVGESDGKGAADLIQKLLSKDPYHVRSLVKSAEVYTILKQDSARISAYDSLCEAYSRVGDFERAVQIAEQLVELDPESSQHKDRLKFFKSKLGGPAMTAAAAAAPSVKSPAPARMPPKSAPPPSAAPIANDHDLPDFGDLEELSAQVPDFGEVLVPEAESAPVPSAPAALDLGDVVELTQEDEENIKEKLTEAEVFVRYGLVEKAVTQLVDVLESFRFHTESREKLIEIYQDQGMTQEAAEQLVHLSQVYDKLGRPDDASKARAQATELNPALAAQAAAPATASPAEEEIELTLSEPSSDFEIGIELEEPAPEPIAPAPQPVAAPAAEEIPLSAEEVAFNEPSIDISIDESEAEEEIGIEMDLGEDTLPADNLGLDSDEFEVAVDVEESSADVEVDIDMDVESSEVSQPAPSALSSASEIEIDLNVSAPDIPFAVEDSPVESAAAEDVSVEIPIEEPEEETLVDEGTPSLDELATSLPEIDVPEPLVSEGDAFSVEIDEPDDLALEIPDAIAEEAPVPEAPQETFAPNLGAFGDAASETDIEIDVPGLDDAEEVDVEVSLDAPMPEPEPPKAPAPAAAPQAARPPAPRPPAPEPLPVAEPEPVPVAPPPAPSRPPEPKSPLAGELAEVDEYIALGLYEDARDSLRELLKQHPGDADVLAKIEELGFSVDQIQMEVAASGGQRLVAAPISEEPEVDLDVAVSLPEEPEPEPEPVTAKSHPVFSKSAIPEPAEPIEEEELTGIEELVSTATPEPVGAMASSNENDFIDLASELSDEIFGTHSALEEDTPGAEGPLTDPGLDQIFKEFRKGVEKQLGTEDYDTRYNLGIAYKEMGLLDEAIAEFQLAAKDEVRGLECCSMLGLCFMEKGMPDIAIKWFSKGLDIPGRREEEYHGLRYDLAQAFEAASHPERALTLYLEIFKENASFRDVKDRLRELQAAQK